RASSSMSPDPTGRRFGWTSPPRRSLVWPNSSSDGRKAGRAPLRGDGTAETSSRREDTMILRRYGTTVQSVDPNFDARAMTEIGFRRNGQLSISAEEFEARYEKVDERALTAESEGDVKDEAERALLDDLLAQLRALEEEVGEDHVLVVESEQG